MVKPICFIQAFLLLILFSCVHEKDKYGQEVKYSLDSLSIQIDSTTLNNYYTHSYNNKLDFFVGYNAQAHSLDYFDINKQRIIKQTKLDKEGKNGIGTIYGIYYHSADSVFVSENGFVKLLNTQGEVIDKYDLISIANSNYSFFGNITANQYVRLQYIPDKKSLLLFSVHDAVDNLSKPLLFMLNITNKKLTALPVYFSEYYIENKGRLGFLSHLNAEVINDEEIVYNYLYSNNLYKYNINSKKMTELTRPNGIEIAKILPSSAGESTEKWEQHAIENPHFFQILKDPYKHRYYQFIWLPLDFKTSDNKYNSFMDKRLLLIVMDEQFNKQGELLLNAKTYMPFSWFVSKRGLMISNTHPQNKKTDEKKLTFHIINAH